ncbi:MAG: serine/threonine protein phosphatase [Chlorobi bacterium]|nr:serine/threonine protein phosphatase [Chlorobiota bacterium]
MRNRLFAIGDVHGCFDSLKYLVETKIQLHKKDKLVLLGDYIDRGDKSKEVVDYIIELKKKGFDIVPLMGNHEALLLDAYKNEKNISKWIQNGGNETLKSFEINSIKNIDPKYLTFFKELEYFYLLGEFLFVHAGFNNDLIKPFDDKYFMLWKCKESYANPLLVNKTIVHGHNPISISKCENRIPSKLAVVNIDTGCVYKDKDGFGRLTAYECNTQRILFV